MNPPKLFLGLALYFNAWFDLDFERDVSEYEPIRRSDCFKYASDYDFDEIQTEDLWFYIARIDKAYLKWKYETTPKKKSVPTMEAPKGKVRKRVGKP